MSLKLYFIRHGETTYSKSGGYCGFLDPELTSIGKEMAQAFAEAYANLSWTAIYSSPMRRTIATAKPLADKIGLDIQTRDGLKEIGYGQWEGKTPKEVDQQFHDDYISWLSDPGWNAPTGGERGVDIQRRSSKVLDQICETHRQGNILLVSHKATIRIMLCALLGVDIGRFRDRIGMPVASVSIVEMADNGPLVHVMGDRAHLPESLRSLSGF